MGNIFELLGLCDLRPVTAGYVSFRAVIEEVRCTVMTEEDDAEFGLEPCRWCVGGFANDAMSTRVERSIQQCLSHQATDRSGGREDSA